MDLEKVLADLHEQLRNLDTAIESLERLQNGKGSRPRGRPPNGSSPRKVTRKMGVDAASGKKRA
jgi:hypothetical protein